MLKRLWTTFNILIYFDVEYMIVDVKFIYSS